MREKLKERKYSRERFTGKFEKYGLKSAYKGLPNETILLLDVQTPQGEIVTDHLWFNHTKGFKNLGDLYPGDIISFDARVRPYVKGYVGRGEDYRETDYKLSHPTKLKLIEKAERIENYYLVCMCGFHNKNDEPDKDLISCRRCGFILKGEVFSVPIDNLPKYKQTIL